MKQKISLLLKALISFGLIGVLIWCFREKLPNIARVLKSVDPLSFILAAIVNVVAIGVISVRLKKILLVQGVKLKLREAIYLNFIGNFFNNFLPTSIGGDLVKAYYATKKTTKKLESFSAVFFDRFFGFLSIGLLAFLGVVFLNKHIKDPALLWGCAIFSLVVMVVFVFFLNKRLTKFLFSGLLDLPIFREGSKMRKLYNALNIYKEHKIVIVEVIGVSLLAQMIAVLAIYIIIKSISPPQDVSFLNLFLIIPLVSVASMLPFTLNGLGLREGAFVFFLKEFISPESAAAVSVLYLALIIITSLIGGILYLFSGKIYKIPIDKI